MICGRRVTASHRRVPHYSRVADAELLIPTSTHAAAVRLQRYVENIVNHERQCFVGIGALHARSISPPLESASSRKEIWTPSTKFPKLRLDRFIRFCTAHRPRYMRHVCERTASTHCMRALRSNNAGGSSAECVRDGKRIATVWCLSVCLSRFYPRDAILARVLAMAMCPCLSVCLSQVSVLSKRMGR